MRARSIHTFAPLVLSIAGALSCEAPCEDTGSCGPYDGGAPGTSGDGGRPGVGGAAGIAGGSALGGHGGLDEGAGGNGAQDGASGESSAGFGGEGGGAVPCDRTKSPTVESCLVDDAYAVFVSPMGSDRASGIQEQPVATLAKAMAIAVRTNKIVIACGEFHETLAIRAGVRMYGGFDCARGWARGTERSVVTAPPGASPALSVEQVPSAVVLEGFEFRATASAVPSPGESVITAVVSESEDVVLRDVKLVAGDGADGESAEPLAPYPTSAADGNDADGLNGGAASACVCSSGGNTSGGRGGDGDLDGVGPDATASPGGDGTPNLGGGKGGAVGKACGSGGIGAPGKDAPAQMDFGKGARQLGAWEGSTWIPGAGAPGPNGLPGQGGGGGRGGTSTTEEPGKGGGGGACGGCGGEGGGFGQGGGASIALVVESSNVTFESGEISVGNGGNGGNGAPGRAGQLGGNGGDGAGSGACDGGEGGSGSAGGAGGGGAGGISVGVLYVGTEPVVESAVLIETGAFGEGGQGGDETQTEDDGIPGVAKAILALPG